MDDDRRSNAQCARIVNAGIEIDTLWGCIRAWRYLHMRQVSADVAARVLSRDGPRRATDAVHPAVRDARARLPETGRQQRAQDGGASPTLAPRTNPAAALAVERAIQLCATDGRHYAEALLRIYGLNTATVMRVLYQPHRRRRVTTP